ncbi:hypothetical protein L6R52_33720 [Myxococcota bacterium]|nr:hypothetical protein [Myxococcota bacterium]
MPSGDYEILFEAEPPPPWVERLYRDGARLTTRDTPFDCDTGPERTVVDARATTFAEALGYFGRMLPPRNTCVIERFRENLQHFERDGRAPRGERDQSPPFRWPSSG